MNMCVRIPTISYTAIGMMLAVLMGCVESSAPRMDPIPHDQVLQSLKLSVLGATMAVGDTLRMAIEAKSLSGERIDIVSGAPPVWTSSDLTKARVDSNGVIVAVGPTGTDEVIITAKWTYRSVTREATVNVMITSERHDIASIMLVSLDSTRIGAVSELDLGSSPMISAIALNSAGQPVPEVKIRVTPMQLDEVLYNGIGVFDLSLLGLSGMHLLIGGTYLGPFWMYASGLFYGVPLIDSLQYTGLYPAVENIAISRDTLTGLLVSPQAGSHTIVQRCARMTYKNDSPFPIDIIFDDPAAVTGCVAGDGSGDIINILPGQTQIRKVPSERDIRWTVRRNDTGVIQPEMTGVLTMRDP